MNRDRPYDEQPHTDYGERGKTFVEGLTMRDVQDCFVRAVLLSSAHLVPKKYEEATKGETAELTHADMYGFNLDEVSPGAIGQNLTCEIERMMGIFPNRPKEEVQ